MKVRSASQEDIDSLIRMRWDFTLEHDSSGKVKEEDYAHFNDECRSFLDGVTQSKIGIFGWWN